MTMRLTIIPEDSAVIIDGLRLLIDCSSLDQTIHAVQWEGICGHIEYVVAGDGEKPTNTVIKNVAQFQPIIDAWAAAKALIDNPPAPPPPTLEQAKASKLIKINRACSLELNAVKSGYPNDEVQSWGKQETEARAYVADNTAPTPLLSALATARGVPLVLLAAKVIEKSDLFATVSGTAIGKRQHCEDLLALAETVADVEAVTWPE